MNFPVIHFDSKNAKMWSDNHSPILFLAFQSHRVGFEYQELLETTKHSLIRMKKKFGQSFLLIDCTHITETFSLMSFLQQSIIAHGKSGIQLQAIIRPAHCKKEILKAIQSIDQHLMPVFDRFESAMTIINELITEFNLHETA